MYCSNVMQIAPTHLPKVVILCYFYKLFLLQVTLLYCRRPIGWFGVFNWQIRRATSLFDYCMYMKMITMFGFAFKESYYFVCLKHRWKLELIYKFRFTQTAVTKQRKRPYYMMKEDCRIEEISTAMSLEDHRKYCRWRGRGILGGKNILLSRNDVTKMLTYKR